MDKYGELANETVARASEAHHRFLELDQKQVDRITEAVFRASFDARFELAERAHAETRIGILDHKVIKNAWASLVVYNSIRDLRTVGVISRDNVNGITEVAHPIGPILALLPVTNPTSTTVFKSLICMKTRNPVIFSPHGGARKCVARAASLMYEAAFAAGAPEHCIQWYKVARRELFEQTINHRELAMILATTTGDMVKRAERSRTPTLGVGPGNVPVYVDRSADLSMAATRIVHSKTFDNGTICASEQALVVTREVCDKLIPLIRDLGTHICSEEEAKALGAVVYDSTNRTMRADVVGQKAERIAKKAGFPVKKGTRMLLAEAKGVGRGHPLSYEILAPVLTLYVTDSFDEALALGAEVRALGGEGHTTAIYAEDPGVIARWRDRLYAGRILINIPATSGAIGGVMNKLDPSLTLGCGSGAGNSSNDNITVRNLLNVCRVTRERLNKDWAKLYPETILDRGVDSFDVNPSDKR